MHPDLPPLNRFPLAREHSRSAEMIAEANLYFSNLKLQTTLSPQARFEHIQTADSAGLIPKSMQQYYHLTDVLTEALACPNGPYDRTLTITRAAILFFIADDYMDSTFEAKLNFLREIKNILNGHPDPGVSGLAREIRDLFKTFAATSTEPEYRQYVRVTHEWFRAEEDPVHPTDISAYLKMRRVNGGAYQFTTFARYAAGIYVSDEQLSDPLLSRCLDLGIDITIFENDLASYEKEIVHEKQPNGRPILNLVGLILRHGADDRQFTTALDVKLFLRTEIERYEEIFHASLSTALSDMDDKGVPKPDHRRRWLYILPYIISGNTWWGQTCGRYNIPGKPVLRKIIHLEGGGDIIEPEPMQ
ncbi:isoprenoid synthase domain-containing protein [Mycena albidolilacea]|uniref:Terpene synthase n=1 Tax=Mycena albidolilacea TaxID=1033008 RepID=A0AAD7EUS8_9AGAR|nr:isoprenoid synthase domain-containing protein [Mycena albidolilacea]